MKLFYALLLLIIAQIISFVQLQGQLKWTFAKNNDFLMMLFGLPVGYIFIKTTKLMYDHFNAAWPGRLIAFAIGSVIFAFMGWVMFREPITIRTIISIMLASVILLIQIYWK